MEKSVIPLIDKNGECITQLTLGCSWGMRITDTMITVVDDNGFYGIGRKTHKEKQRLSVDLDLSCIFISDKGEMCDHLYSPKFKKNLLNQYGLPAGKYEANTGYAHHSGDDLKGSKDTSDNDNEMISIDMSAVSPMVKQIVFFLNNTGHGTLDKLPYINIHLSKTNSATELWRIDASKLAQCKDKNTLIIGKIQRVGSEWEYEPIEEAFKDEHLCETIMRILNHKI